MILSEYYYDLLSDCQSDSDSEANEYSSSESEREIVRGREERPQQLVIYESESGNDSDTGTRFMPNPNLTSFWTMVDTPPIIENFLGNAGVKSYTSRWKYRWYCKHYFSWWFFQMIYDETKRFHVQTSQNFTQSPKSLKWKEVTVEELKIFMGLILLMGYVKKDTLKDYWSTDPLIETPVFSIYE